MKNHAKIKAENGIKTCLRAFKDKRIDINFATESIFEIMKKHDPFFSIGSFLAGIYTGVLISYILYLTII